jgi:hypothetical protein
MTGAYNFREHTPEAGGREKNLPIGTTESGYAPPSDGPFECGNCVHYHPVNGTNGGCDHPDVIEDAEKGEIPRTGSKALVARGGCCTYFRPEEIDAS